MKSVIRGPIPPRRERLVDRWLRLVCCARLRWLSRVAWLVWVVRVLWWLWVLRSLWWLSRRLWLPVVSQVVLEEVSVGSRPFRVPGEPARVVLEVCAGLSWMHNCEQRSNMTYSWGGWQTSARWGGPCSPTSRCRMHAWSGLRRCSSPPQGMQQLRRRVRRAVVLTECGLLTILALIAAWSAPGNGLHERWRGANAFAIARTASCRGNRFADTAALHAICQ
jgi:hypothetical protein